MTPDSVRPPEQPSDDSLDDGTAALLRATRATAFAPGFADRVARRVAADRGDRATVAATLPAHFRRLVPAVLAASLALAAVNLWRSGDEGGGAAAGSVGSPGGTLASAAGLQTVRLADALTVADAAELP